MTTQKDSVEAMNAYVYGEKLIARPKLDPEHAEKVSADYRRGTTEILRRFPQTATSIIDWERDLELIDAANTTKSLILTAGENLKASASNPRPSFSIITPYFRHLDFFAACAASVAHAFAAVEEDQIPLEWIVLNDDPSTSAEILEQRMPEGLRSRTKIVQDGQNRGIVARLNEGIETARHEWIVFLDCDDELAPDALSRLSLRIAELPRARYFSTSMADIDENGETLRVRLRHDRASDLPHRFMIAGHMKAIRRDLFSEIGRLDPAYEGVQDFEFALRASVHESIVLTPDIAYRYRWHGNTQSVSAATRQETNARKAVIETARRHSGKLALKWAAPADAEFPALTRGQIGGLEMGVLDHSPPDIASPASRQYFYVLGVFLHSFPGSLIPIILDAPHRDWLAEYIEGSPRWLRLLVPNLYPQLASFLGTPEGNLRIAFEIALSSSASFGPRLREISPDLHSGLCKTNQDGIPYGLELLLTPRTDVGNLFRQHGSTFLIKWWNDYGRVEHPGLGGILGGESGTPRPVAEYGNYDQGGINIVGFSKGGFGVAEDTRMAAISSDQAGIPFSIYEPPYKTLHQDSDLSAEKWIEPTPRYSTNLVYLPAIETLRLQMQTQDRLLANRFNILAWQWELPHWPANYVKCMDLADELWPSTEFTANAMREYASVPVVRMPMAVTIPKFERRDRDFFGLEREPYHFLFVYDGLSWQERKNPMAVVQAFQKAFPNNPDVRLVIKTMNSQSSTYLKRLTDLAASDSRLIMKFGTLPRADILSLFANCDAYVSLHRAEGFGRTIAEAMILEKPVIVSDFSGSRDFCLPATAFLVEGKLIPVPKDGYAEPKGQTWFDASVESAAQQMKLCYEDRGLAAKVAKQGREYLEKHYSPEAVGRGYRNRLKEIGLI